MELLKGHSSKWLSKLSISSLMPKAVAHMKPCLGEGTGVNKRVEEQALDRPSLRRQIL